MLGNVLHHKQNDETTFGSLMKRAKNHIITPAQRTNEYEYLQMQVNYCCDENLKQTTEKHTLQCWVLRALLGLCFLWILRNLFLQIVCEQDSFCLRALLQLPLLASGSESLFHIMFLVTLLLSLFGNFTEFNVPFCLCLSFSLDHRLSVSQNQTSQRAFAGTTNSCEFSFLLIVTSSVPWPLKPVFCISFTSQMNGHDLHPPPPAKFCREGRLCCFISVCQNLNVLQLEWINNMFLVTDTVKSVA